MKKNFWLMFAITEASTVAEAFLAQTNLTAEQKAALDALIKAADQVGAVF